MFRIVFIGFAHRSDSLLVIGIVAISPERLRDVCGQPKNEPL